MNDSEKTVVKNFLSLKEIIGRHHQLIYREKRRKPSIILSHWKQGMQASDTSPGKCS